MTSRTRSILVFGAKATVAAVLIGWLVRSGALDFGALSLLVREPWLMAANVALYAIGATCGALRYRFLVGLVGARLSVFRAIHLQLTAMFFNVVIPGSVGGDVLKAIYISRELPAERRTSVFLLVFVDRLIGMAALVLVASSIAVLRGETLWSTPELRTLAIAVGALGFCTLVGPALFVLFMRRAGDRLEMLTSGPSKLAKLLNRLVAAARLLSSGPRSLAAALVISMTMHAAAMTYFLLLARGVTGQPVPFGAVATVFPLGMLTLVLPIAPSGLGVGHVAFDRLFAMIGLTGGATVFNLYLLSQIALCLLGVFPYLALRRHGSLPTAEEAAAIEKGDGGPA